jgi:hypothetical protein
MVLQVVHSITTRGVLYAQAVFHAGERNFTHATLGGGMTLPRSFISVSFVTCGQ